MQKNDLHSSDENNSIFGASGFPRKKYNCHVPLGEGGLKRHGNH